MQLPCIIAGECYNADPEAIISQALQTGGGPNVSDANTTNGLAGRCLGTSPRQSNQPSKVPMELCFKFRPNTALLQANFSGRSNSAYTPKFPTSPLVPFNHTGTPKNNTKMSNGTKLVVLPFT
ncbi:hypothetical protein KPL70_024406 [Citrus sinensis]|nr:hypothetical protein KPL70_024406 [Citrus sinensis]